MNNLLDFIERHKFGILITLAIHVGIFVYFQVATYKEAVLFEPWEFRNAKDESIDDIQIDPDQIQTPEEQSLLQPQEKVTAFVRDQNDTRKTSQDENTKYTSTYSKTGAEQLERDYEQSIKDQIQKAREEKEGKKTKVSTAIKNEGNKPPKKDAGQGSNSSTEAIGGKTMVSFSLINRHPLNHNDWNVRNPGYTCGNVNGIVTIAISVDVGGEVIGASVIEEQSQGATPCMLEKAREYAMKSRFNYTSSAPKKQEGTITYRFVYR
ncbi:hypothetical protein [Brumimicrobium mesophilum]|uniref:hypothetical protein n=1 Tax=Brumimicrobium mesophilum TaxID=392717 RepID=UPI000D142EFB|nr:hypothetical protein [Brumimicrobium mesophilum]